jgi:hypothetical protein
MLPLLLVVLCRSAEDNPLLKAATTGLPEVVKQ